MKLTGTMVVLALSTFIFLLGGYAVLLLRLILWLSDRRDLKRERARTRVRIHGGKPTSKKIKECPVCGRRMFPEASAVLAELYWRCPNCDNRIPCKTEVADVYMKSGLVGERVK